jgi:methylmalonyl-CoA epimerase
MIKGLAHIGVVVNNIDDALTILNSAFGAIDVSPGGRKSFPDLGQTSALVQIGNLILELMEPYGNVEGTVSKYLSKHGPGLHHISLFSDDLNADDAALASAGIHSIGKGIVKETGDQILFTHPKETVGVVFEITQPAKP